MSFRPPLAFDEVSSIVNVFLLAQAAQPQQPGLFDMVLPFLLILGVFYFLLWRPQAKRQKEHQSFLGGLKTGDEVVSTGGIIGTVKSMEENIVTLEVSKGSKLRILKSQIRGPLGSFAGGGDSADKKSES